MPDLCTPSAETFHVEAYGTRACVRYRPGAGPAVVMLTGGVLDTACLTWKALFERFPPHFRVFLVELPGYGGSDVPEVPYTTAWFTDWLEAWVEAVGINRFTLCGNSMSGAIAIGYALRHPARVEGLVLNGAYGVQPRIPLHPVAYVLARIPRIEHLARRVLRLHPASVRIALLAAARPDHITDELVQDTQAGLEAPRALEAFAAWLRSELFPTRLRTDFTDRLPELGMPVLFLHGTYDLMAPVQQTRDAVTRVRNGALHELPGGHLIPREYPEETARVVAAFIGGAMG